MTVEHLTAGGRIVWGNPAEMRVQKDQRTKQPKIGKDGKPVEQCAFGLAIPKAEFGATWAAMQQAAAMVYPNGVPSGFSWKFKDGDGVDRQGKPYNTREGYAGCYVLTISTTTFAPPIYKFENGAYRQLNANEIKTGDFARVSLILKGNAPTDPSHTPGLYVNPKGVEFLGYGQEIINGGGDPDEMFGGAPAPVPAGASAVPISSAPTSVAMPGMPQTASAPQGYPQPGYPAPAPQGYSQPAPVAAPQGYPQPQPAAPMPAPAHDFVQNAGVPQGYPQPAPVAAPQGYPQPGYPQGPQPQYAGGVAPQPAPMTAPATYGAAPVTTYPSNPGMMPGMPQPR